MHQVGQHFLFRCANVYTYRFFLRSASNLTLKQEIIIDSEVGHTWPYQLTTDIDQDASVKHGTLIPKIPLKFIGFSSTIGGRPSNEDRYCFGKINKHLQYFAVFDGHGGFLASQFACDHVRSVLLKEVLANNNDIQLSIRLGLHQLNQDLDKQLKEYGETMIGSTATLCVIEDGIKLYIANIGDSRALLARSTAAVRLTEDHVPELDSERRRVVKSGGIFEMDNSGREKVMGKLAMTRALGDIGLKNKGVISQPTIRTLRIKHGTDSFIIVMTDGVHNVLSDDEILRTVFGCITPAEAAGLLVEKAIDFGSQDNCTVIVIPLGAWAKFYTPPDVECNLGRIISNSVKYL